MPIAARKRSQPSRFGAVGWSDLERELDAWTAVGRTATLWWRDDDAAGVTPALERLLDLADELDVTLALAVIPARADRSLRRLLARSRRVVVFQHGYAHANHAPPGAKKAELGPHRPRSVMRRELAAGRVRLDRLLGGPGGVPMLPVLVPPWNRIDPALLPELSGIGFGGLSGFAGRRDATAECLVRADSHVDIVDWPARRADRRPPFVGTSAALGRLVERLAARRRGRADPDRPTGLLTHHLVLDEAGWAFAAELVRRSTGHGGARWLDPRRVFAGGEQVP